MRFDEGIFGLYSRIYENRREVEYSLEDYLRACSDDAAFYAGPAERLLKAIGEPNHGRHQPGPAARPHLHEPHDQGLSVLRRDFFGMEDTIERIVGFFRYAAQGLEERKQILYLLGPVGGGKSSLAERLKQLMETAADLCAQGRQRDQPGFRIAARPVRPDDRMGDLLEKTIRHRAPPPDRPHLAVGGQAPRRIRRRHLQVQRRQADAVAAAPDRHRQDRAGRREQPGRLRAGRQGRYPQARELQPERSRRLFLLAAASTARRRACWNSSRCSRRRSRCCTRC